MVVAMYRIEDEREGASTNVADAGASAHGMAGGPRYTSLSSFALDDMTTGGAGAVAASSPNSLSKSLTYF